MSSGCQNLTHLAGKLSLLLWTTKTCKCYHFDGRCAEIQIRDGRVVALQDIDAFPGQSLDDGLVALKRGGLLSVKDEPTHTAVELCRLQHADDGRLDVFLLILVCIKRVP